MQEGEEEEEEEDEEDLPPSLDPVGEDEGPELIPDAGDGSAEAAVPTWAASAAAMDAPATATTGLAAAGDGALAMVAVPAAQQWCMLALARPVLHQPSRYHQQPLYLQHAHMSNRIPKTC